MKKKLTVGLVFALILFLTTLTALAMELSGWGLTDWLARKAADQQVPTTIPATHGDTDHRVATLQLRELTTDGYGVYTALAITPKDGIGWTEVKGDEPYNFLDELGIGQFVKPVPKEVAAVSAEAVTVPLGSERYIMPTVTPASAAPEAKFTYSTEDDDVITVDENGLVKGIAPGTGVVTVSCGSVSTNVEITVTAGALLLGDADLSGEVDIIDATTIQRHDVDLLTLVGTALQLADVDRDGEVTIIDATWIQRWVSEMKAPEGIGKPI